MYSLTDLPFVILHENNPEALRPSIRGKGTPSLVGPDHR